MNGMEIGELIALAGLIGVGFKGWMVVQKELTRLDADVRNLKEDADKDRVQYMAIFKEIKHKLEVITEKLMK